MKNYTILVVLCICLVACSSNTSKKQGENIELVKNYVQSVQALDVNSMAQYLDENYLGIGPSFGDSIRKNEAVENWKLLVSQLYEKIEYTRSHFEAITVTEGDNKGDWVANWAELTITYKNGRGSVVIWASTNYQVANGKIVKSITFYNEADALRQLGYTIIPPGF
jgi:hypothetical protein